MSKQDRQGVRTPAQLEQRYNFGKRFAELLGVAADARDQAGEAGRAVEELDKSFSPEGIFDRLTDGGKVQGIYRGADGNIYINADYIKSGTILAELLKAGIIRSKDGTARFNLDENAIEFIGDLYPGTDDESTRSRCTLKNDAGGFQLFSQCAGGILGLNVFASNAGAAIYIWKDEAGVAGMRLLDTGKGYLYASQVSVWDPPALDTDAANKAYVDGKIAELEKRITALCG